MKFGNSALSLACTGGLVAFAMVAGRIYSGQQNDALRAAGTETALYGRSFCDEPPRPGRRPVITVLVYAEYLNKRFPQDAKIDILMGEEGKGIFTRVAIGEPNTENAAISVLRTGIPGQGGRLNEFELGQKWEIEARINKKEGGFRPKPPETFIGKPLEIGC